MFGDYCYKNGEPLHKLPPEYKRDCSLYEGVRAYKKRMLVDEIRLTKKKLKRLEKELEQLK